MLLVVLAVVIIIVEEGVEGEPCGGAAGGLGSGPTVVGEDVDGEPPL
jgi:hypothetical protein